MILMMLMRIVCGLNVSTSVNYMLNMDINDLDDERWSIGGAEGIGYWLLAGIDNDNDNDAVPNNYFGTAHTPTRS